MSRKLISRNGRWITWPDHAWFDFLGKLRAAEIVTAEFGRPFSRVSEADVKAVLVFITNYLARNPLPAITNLSEFNKHAGVYRRIERFQELKHICEIGEFRIE